MYNNMTVSQLRKHARGMNPQPATGVAISGANKEQLLAWLDGQPINEETLSVTHKIETGGDPDPTTTTTPPQFNGQANDYLANLQSALQPLIGDIQTKQVIDEDRIVDLIKQHQPKAREIVVKQISMPDVNVGIQHCHFETMLKNAVARVPVMLVGPSGSGKTHSAGQLAKALELDYEAISCNPMTSKTDLLGYKDANGAYHDTALVRRFRDGGVMMLDEIDASNASVLTSINMCTSNGQMATPVGMIDKHADFILVAGANTWGNGATPEFVGRNKLDLATKKRFFMLDWDYDESIEVSISDAKTTEELEIVSELQKFRATARKLELRVSITPRDSIYGVRLLRAGMSKDEIFKGLVFADLDKSTIIKIKG